MTQDIVNKSIYFVLVFLVSLALANAYVNFQQQRAFMSKGKRATYCDSLRLRAEVLPKYKLDPYCETNELDTPIQQYLKY
jgi:hypothetical protein